MIIPNKIKSHKFEHFDPEGNSLGFLNEIENLDLRYQIAKENAIGYYIIFEDKKINIDNNGNCDEWPKGMYDQMLPIFCKLIEIRKSKLK